MKRVLKAVMHFLNFVVPSKYICISNVVPQISIELCKIRIRISCILRYIRKYIAEEAQGAKFFIEI